MIRKPIDYDDLYDGLLKAEALAEVIRHSAVQQFEASELLENLVHRLKEMYGE